MKKLLLYGLTTLVFSQARAQDALTFKMKYAPDHKYTMAMAFGVDLNVNMTGNQAMIDKLKAQGVTLPVALKLNLGINGDITAGKKSADNNFPLLINLGLGDLSINIAGNTIDPLKGKNVAIKIYAHDGADGKMQADSSFVNNKKDTGQVAMSGLLTALQRQIKFPDHPLKVGDSFTQDAPMNLPMTSKLGIVPSKIMGQTTYKLVSVADGKAYFDITQTMDVELTVKTAKVTLTGTGTGKAVYSVTDNYPLSMDDNIKMKLNVTAGTMIIDGTADINVTSKHTISQ